MKEDIEQIIYRKNNHYVCNAETILMEALEQSVDVKIFRGLNNKIKMGVLGDMWYISSYTIQYIDRPVDNYIKNKIKIN